jgi:hypothetical protein
MSQTGNLPDHLIDVFERSSKNLTLDQSEAVKTLLREYGDIFSKDDSDLGRTGLVRHEISTGEAKPIKQPPRRLPIHQRSEAEQQIKDMLERRVIEESNSPWSSPIVLVKKKDGSTRFCVDYRRLNEVTHKDAYPLPKIDESLDGLSGSQWFSTLDLAAGYWQVEVDPNDRPKTAFTTGTGLFQFRVMPFGLCNAPSTFERLMENVLKGLQWDTCLIYLDDLIIHSVTFDNQICRLREVFDRLRMANLILKPKKCNLFCSEVSYLGHVVSNKGIHTDPTKIEAVKEWPVPNNLKEVRSFVGLCSYYRRFIKNFSKIARPLHKLTEVNQVFTWSQECMDSFCSLQHSLISAPILAYPNPVSRYILDTDASDFGIGAVLSQVQDGQERVIAYASKSLSRSERRYCVTRKELLAIVKFVKHFKHYLYGQRFLVRTDHGALRWLFNFKSPEGQVARWLETLSSFDFEIEHRAGRSHSNADGLSRRPCRQCGDGVEDNDFLHSEEFQRKAREILSPEPVHKVNQIQAKLTSNALLTPQSVCWLQGWDQAKLREQQLADPVIGKILPLKMDDLSKPKWEEISTESPEFKAYWQQWRW